MDIDQLRFSVPEILSLVGLAQCIYVLVYMAFHAGDRKQAIFPFLYFFVVSIAFFLDFAQAYVSEAIPLYYAWQWGAWFLAIPLSVLLIVQVAQLDSTLTRRFHWVVWLVPISFLVALGFVFTDQSCVFPNACAPFQDWLIVTGTAAGAIIMGGLWLRRDIFSGLKSQKKGKERYWVVMILIFADLLFLFFMLVGLSAVISADEVALIRTFLGLGFVYLAGSGLFRVYPQALIIRSARKRDGDDGLNGEELFLAHRIEQLLLREKVYHEASYSRADLAQELSVSESVLSRVINEHFQKSFPQLLNDKRIEDAQHFLKNTDIQIKSIAEECGFNSLPTFNRVFRQTVGVTPGDFRNILNEKDSE